MFLPLGGDSDVHPATAALQPKPGIGDMIWQLPTLKALAANDPTGRIDLIVHENLPVRELLDGEGFVNHVYFLPMKKDFAGRVQTGVQLSRALAPRRYGRMFVLHHSCRYTLAARLAGIPNVYGWGLGTQRFLLTQPSTLMPSHYMTPQFTLDLGRALLDKLGIPRGDAPPRLHPRPERVDEMRLAYASWPRPWIGFGIGSTEARRIWPPERFALIADALWSEGHRSLFLLGTGRETALAQAIIAHCRIAQPVAVTERRLDQVIALMSQCAFNFCTDSGLMNVSAALGVPVYVLFGTVAPYTFSPVLRPIVPAAGIDPEQGARRISIEDAAAVLRRDGLLSREAFKDACDKHPLRLADAS